MKQGLFLTSFFLSFAFMAAGGRAYLVEARHQALAAGGVLSPDTMSQRFSASIRGLPESYFDSHTASAAQAKRRRLFWPNFERAGSLPWSSEARGFGIGTGMGLRILENAELRESVFPGYGRSLPPDHDAFWTQYFSRTFNAKIWVPQLAAAGFAVNIPWAGCLDVYREAGADVLIFGTSETYRGIIPKKIQTSVLPNARVLQCARGGMYLDETLAVLKAMNTTQRPKSRWAIWGLSPWNLDEAQLDYGHNLGRKKEAERDLDAEPSETVHARLSDVFPDSGWAEYLPQTFQEARKLGRDPLLAQFRANQESYWWEKDRFVFVPEKVSAPALEKLAAPYRTRKAAEPEHCEISAQVKERFENTLRAMEARAEKILVYVPPVTDIFDGQHSRCQVARFREWLEAHRKDNVVVVTRDWKDYSLSYADYLYPSWFKDWNYLNNNHVNYGGAERVTEVLASELKQHDRATTNHL